MAATFGVGADDLLTRADVIDPRTGRSLNIAHGLDTTITLNDTTMTLGGGSHGLTFVDATADTLPAGVRLTFTYASAALHTKVVRHYACYPGSPTIETWTHVEVADGAPPVSVSGLTGWQLTVPAGTVHWSNGLRGDAPDAPSDDAFTLRRKDLGSDEQWHMYALRRSSEQYVPFIMIEGAAETWYGGIQWSGAWEIICRRHGSQIDVAVEFPEIITVVTAETPLEIPHSFFGVAPNGPSEVGHAVRDFIINGVREGRPLTPLVTYNTWYSYGTRIDETTVMNEMNQTAALGVELFVLDAGWYRGAGRDGTFDFETGLGNWHEDSERFPNGLRALADFARDSGMKFGLWIEPARVDLDTVGARGMAEDAWLARRDGRNVSEKTGQICFGTRAGREWVLNQLTRLIDEIRPDYLKWDNNLWINCDRSGHDHGPLDGNLAQVHGLYSILETLRDRYPSLLIENVSDGGSRLDFGWLRYSDAAWISDRTQPSIHVRHNLEGLSSVLPPAYLLSFVVDSDLEPLVGAPDVRAYVRSRMPGVLGFSHRSPGLRPSVGGPFVAAIAVYREIRDILANADAVLLSDQAESVTEIGWDVLEELDSTTGSAVLFAYQQQNGVPRLLIHPRGLRPDADYAVSSVDAGPLDVVRGADLMAQGIEIVQGDSSTAHILILRVQ